MNNITKTILIVAGVLIIGAGIWVYRGWNKYAPTTYVQESTDSTGTTTQTTVNTETDTTTPGAPTYTLAEVGTHNNAASCYSVINGKVYDLTLWINMHPGGKSAILSLCGIDGTARFMAKHKGAKQQMDVLARFYIGNLQ
ncbi:MAG: cytochrome b5 domain-containing protein [Candidatus Paceibacterota bacterium]